MLELELFILSFSGGAASFLNPCSSVLLPAYLSYFLGAEKDEDGPKSTGKDILKGFKYGMTATMGFATVFISTGILISLISVQIKPVLPYLLLAIGIILIFIGILWLLNKPILDFNHRIINVKLSKSSFYLFGITYAISSLACVFPVFLMLVFTAMGAGGIFSGLGVFISFTLGMGIPMVISSIAISISKTLLIDRIKLLRKYITRIAGAILLFAGIYLIYYWKSALGL